MDNINVILIVPEKLNGIKEEIENIKSYNNKQFYIRVTNVFTEIKAFNNYNNGSHKEDVIIVFESIIEARANEEKAQSEILQTLRNIKCQEYEPKIIVVLSKKKEKDLSFVNELIKLDVQNFFFIDSFSIDDITNWIFEPSKTLKENLKYVDTELKSNQKEIVTKEVTKYIEVPVGMIANDKAGKSKSIKAKSKAIDSNIMSSTNIIGILGTSPGVGVTSLCINYATYLKEKNKKVLLLDRSKNKSMSGIEIKGQEIRNNVLAEINIQKYDYIIIDFGMVADIIDNEVHLREDMNNEKKIERSFCNNIILVGSTLPWKLEELKIYSEDVLFEKLTEEWIFYLNGELNVAFKQFKKILEKRRQIIVSYEHEDALQDIERVINNGDRVC